MSNLFQIATAQAIVDELFKVEKIVVGDQPFEVDIHFSGNRSMRVTGKFAADIINAGKTITGRIRSDKPNIQDIPRDGKNRRFIHLWSEGYAATGQSAPAKYHGKFFAIDLKDAVKQFRDKLPESDRHYINLESLSFWGCRFYDNEIDARRSFG